MKQIFILTLSLCITGLSFGQTTLYESDFSTVGGFEHTDSNPPLAGPQELDLGNFKIGYETTPGTDTTLNYFRSDGTLLESGDFGGAAYFVTEPIAISSYSSFSISAIGQTVGSAVFNSSGEEFKWSYSIDGSVVEGPSLTADGSLNSPAEWQNIAVTGATLILRFDYNINGANDGFEISQVKVITEDLQFSNGTWTPNAPTTGSEDVIITNGTYTINTSVAVNDMTINPGASVIIEASGSLTATNVQLESTSSSYSNIINDGTLNGSVSYTRFANVVGTGAPGTGGNDLVSSPLLPAPNMTFDTFLGLGNPLNSAKLASDPGPITTYAFGPYNNSGPIPGYENYTSESTDNLVKAKGYRAATVSGENLTFTGVVESGNVTITLTNPAGGNKWNLIGNPFPSYIDAISWLNTNSGILDPNAIAIYGYNSDTYSGSEASVGNFTIINNSSNSSLNIAPGQGFFVAAGPGNISGEAGTVIFAGGTGFPDDMRTTSGTDDFIEGRTNAINYHLNLDLIGTKTYTTSFYFNENSSLGLDPGYDAATFDAFEATNLYSHLVSDNEGRAMAIQSLGLNDLQNVTIPLGVNANQGEALTFSIGATTLPNTINVYLEDVETNSSTLLNNADYTVTVNDSFNGTGRFYLHLTDSALSAPEHSLHLIQIYTDPVAKTIVFSGELTEATSASLYDLQGRKIHTETLQPVKTSQRIDVSTLSSGIYVVQLVNSTTKQATKVVLK